METTFGTWLTIDQTQDLHKPHPRLPLLASRLLPPEPSHQAPKHMAVTRKSNHPPTPTAQPQLTLPARRIRIQPRRQNRGRLQHLGARRAVRARASRAGAQIRHPQRRAAHHLDLDAQTHDPDGAPPSRPDGLEDTRVEGARRARVGRLRRHDLRGDRVRVPGRLSRARRRQVQLPLPRRRVVP